MDPEPKKRRFPQEKHEQRRRKQEQFLKKVDKAKVKKEKEEEESKKFEAQKLVDQEKPMKEGYTISVALPGSILENAQSLELRTYLAGQIARAATIFRVDELIVFDEEGQGPRTTEGEFTGIGKKGNCCVQMARILQFLECPQYLRKAFFPKHQDLQYAGLLNPLDAPHHARRNEKVPYREGVVLNRPVSAGKGSFVDCGLVKEVQIDRHLQPGVRVTVKMDKGTKGHAVSPRAPHTDAGLYWGYSVRLAPSLSCVMTECPYSGGYDLTVGTSERGESVDDHDLPSFRHILVVLGGLHGLEAAVTGDPKLQVSDPQPLFDLYLNTCPGQGSGTIRTEEALLITLTTLRPKIMQSGL
uniref:28S rRNA (uridine-N(3))-methyltransferase n=1 Tax=Eptatretus burgeri TaxID=7764 RepID=A0A8C4Q2A5_EPTBU